MNEIITLKTIDIEHCDGWGYTIDEGDEYLVRIRSYDRDEKGYKKTYHDAEFQISTLALPNVIKALQEVYDKMKEENRE